MNIVFVVDSEEQLTNGIAWCKKLVRTGARSLSVIVVGVDRKTLAEHSRRRIAEHIDSIPIHVELVERDAAKILEHVVPSRDHILLLVYRADDDDLQKKLFQGSGSRSIWVRGIPRDRESPGQIVSVFPDHEMTVTASERILKVTPTSVLSLTVLTDREHLDAVIGAAMKDRQLHSGDLVVCGADQFGPNDIGYHAGISLLKQPSEASIAVVHSGHNVFESLSSDIYRMAARVVPPMDRDARRELAQDLESGSRPNVEFLGLMSASAMLAAFGLLQDSAAVIIGAMLIAPLMTPIIGAGLALTQGNRPLFQSAIRTVLLGFLGALSASVLFGWLVLLFQEPKITDEMWSRCRPSPLDFCVGLVGGIAASYARTRSHLSSALAGAAIAAALVPPISTAGLQIAFGAWNWEEPDGIPVIPVGGPLLLAGINVVTIMIGSSIVLWTRGMRIDPTHALKDRWTLRTLALLTLLAMLTLIWVVSP